MVFRIISFGQGTQSVMYYSYQHKKNFSLIFIHFKNFLITTCSHHGNSQLYSFYVMRLQNLNAFIISHGPHDSPVE